MIVAAALVAGVASDAGHEKRASSMPTVTTKDKWVTLTVGAETHAGFSAAFMRPEGDKS